MPPNRTLRRRALTPLSHVRRVGASHAARMVDVGAKPVRSRSAVARACVCFARGALSGVLAAGGPKGPVMEVARVAGVLAAKRTADLIPLCHPLGLDHVEIVFAPRAGDVLEVRCKAASRGRTGVEMEALTGAAIAALTVYDMTKALDHGIRIESLELLEKRGGRSGIWRKGAARRPGSTGRSVSRSVTGSPGSKRSPGSTGSPGSPGSRGGGGGARAR